MRIRVKPYINGSKSAKKISQGIPCLRLRKFGSRFRSRNGDLIINWGSSTRHPGDTCTYINKPETIQISNNKLKAFKKMQDYHIPLPDWTTDPTVVHGWLFEGYTVFGRQKLSGHSGQGIVIINPGEDVPPCPLYTKRVKRKAEYRIHVFGGNILDIQQKRRRNGSERGQSIWNHNNGYVYCRENLNPLPEYAKTVAIQAVASLGLDFGAVDIAITSENKPIVFEVNSAPGLAGTTKELYINAFKRLLQNEYI